MNDTKKKRHFVVVMYFASSAIFEKNHNLVISSPRDNDTPVEVTFTTRYLDRGFDVQVPGAIQATARGSESNTNSAAESFSTVANLSALCLAIVSNAWIGFPEVLLAYDDTPDEQEREYLQVYVPEEPFEYVANRRIPSDAVEPLLSALGRLGESHQTHPNRIMRAAVQ